MKLVIEVDVDQVDYGMSLREMIKALMSGLDQVPDRGRISQAFDSFPDEPFLVFCESINEKTKVTEGRIVLTKDKFDTTGYSRQQIEKHNHKFDVVEAAIPFPSPR